MIDLASCYPYVPQQEVLLREAIASSLESGDCSTYGPVVGDPESVGIIGRALLGTGDGRAAALTPTGQSALAVVFSVLCKKPGARVAVEDRTFPFAKEVLKRFGAKLIPIPTDSGGMIPGFLETAAREGLNILYTMPSIHNPAGTSMTENRRIEITALAQRYHLQIVEDCAYSFLDGGSIPTLASLASQRTFQVFSLSKTISLGLRMGALTAPSDAMPRVVHAIRTWGAIANPMMVKAGATLAANDAVEPLIHAKIREARSRQALACRILDHQMIPSAAWHILLETPANISGTLFAAAAAAKGVSLLPGRLFRADNEDENTVRLSLGGENNLDKLQAGIEIIEELLRN